MYKYIKQIKSGSSLESLGTLVSGVPSESIEAVPASELLSASRSPAFVSSMLTATVVVQQTFVKKVQCQFGTYSTVIHDSQVDILTTRGSALGVILRLRGAKTT